MFPTTQVMEQVGATFRQLDYWDRTDLVKPSILSAHGSGSSRLYSGRDVELLKLVVRLLHAGLMLQAIRAILEEVGDGPIPIGLVVKGDEKELVYSVA